MSTGTKQDMEYTKRYFKLLTQEVESYRKTTPDKQLIEKFKKIGETSKEIVKHIEERQGDKG